MKKLLLASALALALAAPRAARAEDSTSSSEGRRSVGFSSSWGLVGMRDLIDARVPSTLNVRGMVRFEHDSTNLDSSSQTHTLDVYGLELIAGASALGIVDAGIRLPFEVRIERDAFHGGPSRRVEANGVGDALLSGKAGFQLGPWIALGPYATVHWNTGSSLLEKTNELHLGGCATVSFLDDRLGLHVNITSVSYDGGKWAIGYRLGASIAPIANKDMVLRFFAYLDGKDYVGTKVQGNDARIFGGAQVLFLEFLTAEVSCGFKVDPGDLPSHVRDTGTYGLDVGAGVSVMF